MKKTSCKIREISIFIAYAALFILFSTSVLSIGITPSKKEITYQPGMRINYDIDIVNNAAEELDVIIYPNGEFQKLVTIRPQMIKLAANDSSKKANIELILPQNLDVSGEHLIEIVAIGTDTKKKNQKTMITADLAVISKLIINVPYPDKYAEARIYISDTEFGKPVSFSIPVFNKGKKDITETKAQIDIYSQEGTKIETIQTDTKPIQSGKNEKLTAKSTKEYLPGGYSAKATVEYDGKTINLESPFNVGDLFIDIQSILINQFTLGEVAKFDILLYNNWNTELKNVYAEMQITDQNNKIYTDFKTVAIDLPASSVGRLEGYWYTQGIAPGIYNARITLHYANKLSQKEYTLEVYPNKIIAREQVIGQAISVDEALDIKNNSYLFLIILILVIIIAVLLVKSKSRPKRNLKIVPADAKIPDSSSDTMISEPANDTKTQSQQMQSQQIKSQIQNTTKDTQKINNENKNDNNTK